MAYKMTPAQMSKALLPYVRQICNDCLPGGRIIGQEYHARNLDGGYRQPKPGGSANSLRVNLVKGVWSDFGDVDIGGDLLNLLSFCKGEGRIGSAMKYAREHYLGSIPADPIPTYQPSSAEVNRKRENKAKWLWSQSLPINNSLGAKYLSHRGLPEIFFNNLSGLRFIPKTYHLETEEMAPAALALLSDVAGRGRGIHRIFLSEDGQKYQKGSPRLGMGNLAGNAFMFGDPEATTIIASESIEDGLSVAYATGASIRAPVSAKHLGLLVVHHYVKVILVAADNDEEGITAYEKLVDRFPDKLVIPAFPPTHFKDYNEFLISNGPNAVKEHLRNRYLSGIKFSRLGFI